jgi:hypothetical protein
MTTRIASRVLPLLLAAALVGACEAAVAMPPVPATPPAASHTPVGPGAPPAPEPPPAPSLPPEATPSPETPPPPRTAPRPDTKPAPEPRAHWTRPSRIGGTDCFGSSFTIDRRGGYHVAAVCGNRVACSRRSTAGRGRRRRSCRRGPRRAGPQLAVDGATLYLATSGWPRRRWLRRRRPPAGRRVLPHASPPGRRVVGATRIGQATDRVQALR